MFSQPSVCHTMRGPRSEVERGTRTEPFLHSATLNSDSAKETSCVKSLLGLEPALTDYDVCCSV